MPGSDVGIAAALADKLETLVGMFGIGSKPTGDKDRFALRRHALGVIRMLSERELPLRLEELIAIAVPAFGPVIEDWAIEDPIAEISDFVFERLTNVLRDQGYTAQDQGYTAQEVAAVVSLRPQRLAEITQRLAAVRAFAALPEAEALATANKRIGNILKKSDVTEGIAVKNDLLREDAERNLAATLHDVQQSSDPLFESGDYQGALRECAALRGPVDAFIRRCHGQRQGRGTAKKPPGLAGRPSRADESRGRLRPTCVVTNPQGSSAAESRSSASPSSRRTDSENLTIRRACVPNASLW